MAELTYTRIFEAPRELVFRCMLEPEVRIHQANVPDTFRPEDQARFATSLDRFAAYLKTRLS